MTIPLERARNVIASFQESGRIQNLFAQSHAKYVLFEVNELPDNFPAFDSQLEDKITFTAYALLAAGCSMLEQQSILEGITGLEAAASLLQNAHEPFAVESRESSFHALVSAMAFYAAGQYSRAFVSIQQIEGTTETAGIIASFIRKDMTNLIQGLNRILLLDRLDFEDQADLDEWVITVAVARSIASVLEYVFTGTPNLLDEANQTLQDASIIATLGRSPAHWWIIRLLRLMFGNLGNASLWRTLPPFFGPETANQLSRYIRLLAFSKPPIIELWTSQLEALSLALNPTNRGGVINLRTSAGKTRVAELAILQTLSSDPHAKVVYLAPFRSLAFEVERILSASFSWLGFQVSHLYGGSRVSSVDTELVFESSITIATPEKARTLFRAFPELFENVKLIIIDEGHLIGPSERFVKNELFIDHLRAFSKSTGARILLLSAVLPNTQELAEWITGDPGAVATSLWKPSAERFGLLRWNGKRVRIDWLGKVESFNPSFVEAKPLGFSKRRNPFPNNKIEAIAATAVRLMSIGPVLIFTGRASSVPTLAKAVMLALGTKPEPHPWPEQEWKVFESTCIEELEPGAVELEAARVGVICHSNRLTAQVRLAIEVLMRSYPSKIIIATTTLGQGVNIGVSSVIVATPYIGERPIDKRSFWNICGRAGRAYVDSEGKILYAIDDVWTKSRSAWHIAKDEHLAKEYFDSRSPDRVESGLLYVINALRRIADQSGVSFDVLIELVANNDFKRLAEQGEVFETILDLLDDELLALHENASVNLSDGDSVEWVDQAFRESLAAIQARDDGAQSNTDDVIRFLQARAASIVKRVPDQSTRKAVVASSLPLSVAIKAHRDLDFFRTLADEYLQSDMSLSSLTIAVQKIESWARTNASSVTDKMPEVSKLDNLREQWLGGVGLRVLIEKDSDASSICKDLYGYKLSWIIHAISQKLDKIIEADRVSALALIALLVEIGVPTELAARIFLAGIRSRVAATELARLDIQFGSSVSSISDNLHNADFRKALFTQVSPETAIWLNLILNDRPYRKTSIPNFAPFRLKQPIDVDTLYSRTFGDDIFLCSLDGTKKIPVESSNDWPFDRIANDPRFVFTQRDGVWKLIARDPKIG
ncbi:MAG: DEAD/DEAH box helicase [Anaerolineae bacterium]|nr:DEAD/DEAH box helicase [Anaerolineae bacterium]